MLFHFSKCDDVTRVAKEQDLGMRRSGCHSNVPEIKALFLNFFIYLHTILFVSIVSVVSFRSFCLFRWFCFICFGSPVSVVSSHFVVLGFSTCRLTYSVVSRPGGSDLTSKHSG